MVSLSEGGPHHWDTVSLHVLCQSHLNRASPALNWGYGGRGSLVEVPWNPGKAQGGPGRSGLAQGAPGKPLVRPEPKGPQGSFGRPLEIRKATEGLGKPLGHLGKPWRLQGGPGKPLAHPDVPGRPGEAPGTSGEAQETPGRPGEAPGTSGQPREARGSPWDILGSSGETPGKPCEVRSDPGRSREASGTPGGPRRPQGSPGKSLEARGTPRFNTDPSFRSHLAQELLIRRHRPTKLPWRP
jgi:hypothetical protein